MDTSILLGWHASLELGKAVIIQDRRDAVQYCILKNDDNNYDVYYRRISEQHWRIWTITNEYQTLINLFRPFDIHPANVAIVQGKMVLAVNVHSPFRNFDFKEN